MGNLKNLKNDSGGIFEIEGKKIAVYKDKEGKITKLSPICPHLGCTVGWNDEEKTWLCPCHISIFSKEGKRISGPAETDLPQI